jgi:hypothetical protein
LSAAAAAECWQNLQQNSLLLVLLVSLLIVVLHWQIHQMPRQQQQKQDLLLLLLSVPAPPCRVASEVPAGPTAAGSAREQNQVHTAVHAPARRQQQPQPKQ